MAEAAEEKLSLSREELGALVADAVKAHIGPAVNDAIRATKKQAEKGAKGAVSEQLEALLAGLKPKALRKLMKKMGGEQEGEGAAAAAAAAEAAAAAGSKKKPPTDEELKARQPDYFKQRLRVEFEERIKALETENVTAKQQAEEAVKLSQLDRALSDLPWASLESRDMARDFYAGKLKRNDEGDLVITDKATGLDKPFEMLIKAEVSTKFENLLAPTGKGGSGLMKGGGAKPGAIDIDANTDVTATPAQKAEASLHLAALLSAGKG